MRDLVCALWFVVLISYAVCAGDEDCLALKPRILCYECSTKRGDRHCGDPFNEANPLAKAFMCDGKCVKWVQKPRAGVVHITRTCSTKLTLNFNLALVCMKESRPGDGHMCVCNSEKCNSGSTLRPECWVALIAVTAATLLATTAPWNDSEKAQDNTQDAREDIVEEAREDVVKAVREDIVDAVGDDIADALHQDVVDTVNGNIGNGVSEKLNDVHEYLVQENTPIDTVEIHAQDNDEYALYQTLRELRYNRLLPDVYIVTS